MQELSRAKLFLLFANPESAGFCMNAKLQNKRLDCAHFLMHRFSIGGHILNLLSPFHLSITPQCNSKGEELFECKNTSKFSRFM